MATLHLRNVPDDLDAALARAAQLHGRSKNRQAIEALRRGLGVDQLQRASLVADIREHRPRVRADIARTVREQRPDGP